MGELVSIITAITIGQNMEVLQNGILILIDRSFLAFPIVIACCYFRKGFPVFQYMFALEVYPNENLIWDSYDGTDGMVQLCMCVMKWLLYACCEISVTYRVYPLTSQRRRKSILEKEYNYAR